ncbi:WD40/YVTN/BNR-like repeat-containing protein [Roseivirga echinicomitans]
MKLAVGTDKGLLIYKQNENSEWLLADIHFIGMPIGAFHSDKNKHLWVAINHKHWGAKVYVSTNLGETFIEVSSPKFSKESPFTLKSIWTITSQNLGSGHRLCVGVEPAALFYSDDSGESWKEMNGLTQHPSRPSWQGGGKGSNSPFLHSILTNPTNEDHLLVGISCAGIFQSHDGGTSWQPTNMGLKAFFLPNSESLVGHDPHTICQSKLNANVLWQQNHCGIYRSEDYGKTWQDITDAQGKAVYGFAMAIAKNNDSEAWVIPAQSDHMRIPHEQKLAVYYTKDAGQHWTPLVNGLPSPAFDLVLRDALAINGNTLAFGTNNGNLYLSIDKGQHWQTISQNLSTVRTASFFL